MPTSHFEQLNEIVELIILSDPRALLDVGVGGGKFGVLAREYLEVWNQPASSSGRTRRIDGIESYADYLTPLHRHVYDELLVGDALEILPRVTRRYDLLLLIDVLEHFEHDDGNGLLRAALAVSDNVLVATPLDAGVVEAADDASLPNPRERHRSQWRRQDFEGFGPRCFLPNRRSILCYLGEKAGWIERQLLRPERRIQYWCPLLLGAYRRARPSLGWLASRLRS
jgi:hypothetical protein